MRHKLIVAALAITIFSATLCAAKANQPAGRFGSTVDVRVINVEAVVTDGDGNRVTGLAPGDFRLIVDGTPVEVDYFTEIRDGDIAPPPADADAELPPAEGLAAGQALPTNYLVFIDDFFPKSSDRNRAIDGLLKDLQLVGVSDQMAVVAYDGTRLERLVNWTASHDKLEAALVQAKSRESGGLHRVIESRNIENTMELRQYASRMRNQVENAMTAAGSSMRAMGSPTGRKVMILMAGGWPYDPSYLLPLNDHSIAERHGVIGGRGLVEGLVDTANLLGYTIYGVDVAGLEGNVGEEAADRGFNLDHALEPGRVAATDLDLSAATTMDIEVPVSAYERERQNHDLLRSVTTETGGVALLNAGAVAGLEASAGDTRTFYWLGFNAPARGNDERHEIELQVLRPDLDIRTRQTYLDLSREQEITILVESSLLFADGDEQNGLKIIVGDAKRRGLKKIRVPLEVKIPVGRMVAIAADGAYEVRLELRVGALDEDGQISDIPTVPVVFSNSQPPSPGSYGTYSTTLELRRGKHDVLVTAYDPLLDLMLASRVSLEF